MVLNDAAREFLAGPVYGHVVTLDEDGTPQVTMAWFDLDVEREELVFATLFDQRKLANLRRDPRVVVSFEDDHVEASGLRPYLVVYGRAELTEGGAPDKLQELARTYLGPDVTFPPMPDPPPGWLVHITPERVSGVGPWTDR